MRISDWSSDVCSSDLALRVAAADRHRLRRAARPGAKAAPPAEARAPHAAMPATVRARLWGCRPRCKVRHARWRGAAPASSDRADRNSVEAGKRVYVRVDLGGGRNLKQ